MATDLVQVELFAAARAAVGRSSIAVAPDVLSVLLDGIERQFPDFVRIRPQCSYLLDGVAVHGDPATVAIPGGSRLDVLPPFAGG